MSTSIVGTRRRHRIRTGTNHVSSVFRLQNPAGMLPNAIRWGLGVKACVAHITCRPGGRRNSRYSSEGVKMSFAGQVHGGTIPAECWRFMQEEGVRCKRGKPFVREEGQNEANLTECCGVLSYGFAAVSGAGLLTMALRASQSLFPCLFQLLRTCFHLSPWSQAFSATVRTFFRNCGNLNSDVRSKHRGSFVWLLYGTPVRDLEWPCFLRARPTPHQKPPPYFAHRAEL